MQQVSLTSNPALPNQGILSKVLRSKVSRVPGKRWPPGRRRYTGGLPARASITTRQR